MRALTDYLPQPARLFSLDFRLPAIKLIEAVDCLAERRVVRHHALLRRIRGRGAPPHGPTRRRPCSLRRGALLRGEKNATYSIDIFRRHHDQVEARLRELKNIIIKYYPSGGTNELNGVLFDIFTCEQELASHNAVEDGIFIPAVERLAADGVQSDEKQETLSAREREIIVCVVGRE